MEQQIKIGIGILIIVVLSSLASGFGVSSSYWKENPLLMYPGETKDVALLLQNLVGDKDMIINVELVEGKEIATLLDKSSEYKIPLGKKDVPINIRIKIPENTDLDENIKVGVLIKELPAENNKMIQTAAGIKETIPILVKTESEVPKAPKDTELSSRQWDLIWIILIIIIVVGILFEEWRIKGKKKKKK